jgi:amidase
MPFDVVETTIADIHAAYKAKTLTVRQLVQAYLDRIQAYDKDGPKINSIIAVNPKALEEADRLDKASSFTGPLHGIPVIVKDQLDVAGMPTTLGSVLFRNHQPDRDSFVAEQLKKAGAIILAKATLGELGGGDTHGSLFGSTKNPYALDRTPGGSSGGPAASVAANFGTVAIGQEGLASIRRPAGWNSLAGMRPTAGFVSRSGVYEGWPGIAGSLGPLTRTVTDLAAVLDVIAVYDPEDPITATTAGRMTKSFSSYLDRNALKGARLGILRESMGLHAEPDSDDFRELTRVFDRSVAELKDAGAEIVDPIVIPNLKELLATRPGSFYGAEHTFDVYMQRNKKPLYKNRDEAIRAPEFAKCDHRAQARWTRPPNPTAHYEFLVAREKLMFAVLKVMADNRLDAIVHKTVEHSPTLISQGVNPPYVDQKGAPHINTFLVFVPSISVPAGWTKDNLPAGITLQGRPYDDGRMIALAYAYEQATKHRRPPAL